MCVCVCVCACVYLYICVCVCVCVCRSMQVTLLTIYYINYQVKRAVKAVFWLKNMKLTHINNHHVEHSKLGQIWNLYRKYKNYMMMDLILKMRHLGYVSNGWLILAVDLILYLSLSLCFCL